MQYKQEGLAFLRMLRSNVRFVSLVAILVLVFVLFSVLLFSDKGRVVAPRKPQVAGAEIAKPQTGQISTAASTVADTPSQSQQMSSALTQTAKPAEPAPAQQPAPVQQTPAPQPFGLSGPAAFSLHAGDISAVYNIHTTDGSQVKWQLATGAAYWGSIMPEKTGAPAFLVVDQPEELNVTNLLQFHIEVQPTLMPGEYRYYEYYVHVSDPARGIDQVYSIGFNLVP